MPIARKIKCKLSVILVFSPGQSVASATATLIAASKAEE